MVSSYTLERLQNANCSGLYNAFLAPGSPNELNIDHALRTQLATRMTRAVGDDTAMMQSLVEVASLFEKAQNSIFKLMSSVSNCYTRILALH
jgi:hypothetical protein